MGVVVRMVIHRSVFAVCVKIPLVIFKIILIGDSILFAKPVFTNYLASCVCTFSDDLLTVFLGTKSALRLS